MKNGLADLTVILDRSGSMDVVRAATIAGLNKFMEEQQAVPGEAAVTLIQFDDKYEVNYSGKPVKEVPPLTAGTYVPRGSTALLDAIGRTINAIVERLGALPEADRPERVIVVIQTDGQENASHEFTAAKINEMIGHQRDVYGWQFVFLGANQDAIASAAAFNIPAAAALSYAGNVAGTTAAFAATSRAAASYRTGAVAAMAYVPQDRDDQKDAGL